MTEPVKVLVSACLLGRKVRYDGGHKRDPFLVECLGRFVTWVPVCPEVECGLPVPREAMHLAGNPGRPRLKGVLTGTDYTERMERWADLRLDQFSEAGLCGYICKEDSPSSGMERVKVHRMKGAPSRTGAGVFTRKFMERFPLIPVEEEGRLRDPVLREMFVERIFCLRRLRDLLESPLSRGALVEFHADHKYLLLSHDRGHHDALGRLVAGAKGIPLRRLHEEYRDLFLAGLTHKATPRKCADVLMHMMGYFKKMLSTDEKQELLEVIEQYRLRRVSRIVPLTLVRHYVRKYGVAYLARQHFLCRHPAEWVLRNHV